MVPKRQPLAKNGGGEKKEELKAEVKMMLTLVDDTEEQLFLHSYYLKIKENENELREILEGLTTNDFFFNFFFKFPFTISPF